MSFKNSPPLKKFQHSDMKKLKIVISAAEDKTPDTGRQQL